MNDKELIKDVYGRKGMIEPKKPEPKYKIGDEVFLLGGIGEIYSFRIDKIINDHGEFWYLNFLKTRSNYDYGEFDQYREDILYPSKPALIQAQIDYWTSLADKDPMSGAFRDEKYDFGCEGVLYR